MQRSSRCHESFFLTWSFPPWVCLALEITALVYWRGWWLIRKTRPAIFPVWRLGCFLAGIASIIVALSSPLDIFSDRLLFLHMAQHFVLMSVAPPLIVLAAPIVPMLRGCPDGSCALSSGLSIRTIGCGASSSRW